MQLESYKKTAPQSRAEIVRLGKMLPESEGIPGLIIELTKTAEASGVAVTSITRGTTTAGSPFGIQTLTLQVSGRYFDVEDFLYRLEEYVAFRNASFRVTGRLLQVTQLSLQAAVDHDHERLAAARGDDRPQRLSVGRRGASGGGGWRCAMSQNRRVLTYIAIALIVGAALALAVALVQQRRRDTPGVTASAAGRRRRRDRHLLGQRGTASLAAADPAKEQPLLDKFTSKDPFIPFPTPGATTRRRRRARTRRARRRRRDLSAKVKVDGTSYNVMQGDKVPGGSAAAFTVTGVTSGDVTFEVIDGELENGDTVVLGQPRRGGPRDARRRASPTTSPSSRSAPAAAAAAAAAAERATPSPCSASTARTASPWRRSRWTARRTPTRRTATSSPPPSARSRSCRST